MFYINLLYLHQYKLYNYEYYGAILIYSTQKYTDFTQANVFLYKTTFISKNKIPERIGI